MSDRIPLDKIVIDDRVRRDMGDLKSLAESIRERGLLHPIVLTPHLHLVAGQRRIEAVRLLGGDDIPYTVARNLTTATSLLEAERDENTCRKDFKPSEAVALGVALEALERPKAKERQVEGGRLGGKGLGQTPTPSRQNSRGGVREIIAPAVGMKPRTYTRAKNVIEAAEDQTLPEEVREVAKAAAADMDRTGNIHRAAEKVAQAKIAHAADVPPSRNSRAGVAVRVAKAKEMAAAGYTSRQIADALGLEIKHMSVFRRRHGVDVPADAVVGKGRHIDSNRVVSTTVIDLEGTVMGLKLVDFDELDPAQVEGWTSSLNDSLRFLRQFVNQMKEKVRD